MSTPLTVHNHGQMMEDWYARYAEGNLSKAAGYNFRQLIRNAIHLQELAEEYLQTIETLARAREAMDREKAILKETLQFAIAGAAGWNLRAQAMMDDDNLALVAAQETQPE